MKGYSIDKTCVLLYLFALIITPAIFFFHYGVWHLSRMDVDEQYYYIHAQRLLEGTYTLNTYRPIGFPAILSGILFLSHQNLVAAQIILITISCLRVPLTYMLSQRVIGYKMVSVMAAVIVAVWPPLVFYGISFYSETVAIPIFLGALVVLPFGSRFLEGRGIGSFIVSGLLLGICALIHPMYFCFAPFALLIIFLEEKRFITALKHIGLFVIGLLIPIIPWSITASLNEKSFILLSNNNFDAMAGGLNPVIIERGFQAVTAPDGRETYVGPGGWLENVYLSHEEENLPQKEKNTLLLRRMTDWIANNPGDALYLQAAKLANMWGLYPFWWQNKMRVYLGNVPIVIFLFLAVCSLIKFRAHFRRLSRFWMIPIFVSCVAMISWGSWRFRQSADIGVIVLASLLLASLLYPYMHNDKKIDLDQREVP